MGRCSFLFRLRALGLAAGLGLTLSAAGGEGVPGDSVERLRGQIQRSMARGEWRQALDSVALALKFDPNHAPVLRQKAEILSVRGQSREADDLYQLLLAGNPEDHDLAFAALENLRRGASGFPSGEFDHRLSGRIRQAGADGFGRWLSRRAERPDFFTLLAGWQPAWRSSGIGPEGALTLAAAWLAGARPDDGAFVAEALPGSWGGLFCYLGGRQRARAGEDATALDLLDEAERRGYPKGEVGYWRGVVHRNRGRARPAMEAWEEHWREADRPERVLFAIISMRIETGDAMGAEMMSRQALAMFPRSPVFQGYNLLALSKRKDDAEFRRYDAQLAAADNLPGRAYGYALRARAAGDAVEARWHFVHAAAHIEKRYGRRLDPDRVEDWLLAGLR